ncbi:uncharacterized protein [Engystomops pustulosus]
MRLRVGIFSRCAESEYRWLLDFLMTEWTVSTFTITNSNHGLFCEEINRCVLVILYHSRNRGRVNITNVTDSLYDDEVEEMSRRLGRHRVIVVIDDLDDSSQEVKDRILRHQHSLRTMTRDIFLFTQEEKTNRELLRPKLESIRSILGAGAAPPGTDPIRVSRPMSGSTEGEHLRILMILGYSSFVLWKTYNFPIPGNVLLMALWGSVTWRAFCIAASDPVLPLNSWGRCALSSIITVFMSCDAYHRPSAYNVVGSVSWILSCANNIYPRYQRGRLIHQVTSHGLVLLTLWFSWGQLDAKTVFQVMSQSLLRSPGVLAALNI